MRNVLVTHADEPIGRRIVKTLFHDPAVGVLLAVGSGPAPRGFDRFLADASGRFGYVQAALHRHRSVSDLFRSGRVRDAAVDTVVHVPSHRMPAGATATLPGGTPSRTAEARLVLQHCAGSASIARLVAIGTAFVYRLAPGNANRLTETSELDLSPDAPPALRSWIDCDMLLHSEIGNERLALTLLRVPTVVATGGRIYLNPLLEGRTGPRARALGFDPLCALVADKDVAQAVAVAVQAGRAGVYNVAGLEAVPLSVLGRWTRRPTLAVPGGLLRAAARLLALAGDEAAAGALSGPHLRHGFTLDTRRAARELGFRPRYRIAMASSDEGDPQLETARI